MIKLTSSIFRKLFLDDNHNTHHHIHKDHPNRIAWVDKDGVHLPLARVEVLLRDHWHLWPHLSWSWSWWLRSSSSSWSASSSSPQAPALSGALQRETFSLQDECRNISIPSSSRTWKHHHHDLCNHDKTNAETILNVNSFTMMINIKCSFNLVILIVLSVSPVPSGRSASWNKTWWCIIDYHSLKISVSCLSKIHKYGYIQIWTHV